MFDYSYFGGIDLAKNHFSIHVVDSTGKVILHKSVTRSNLLTTIANIPQNHAKRFNSLTLATGSQFTHLIPL
jgi:hypothetical protein